MLKRYDSVKPTLVHRLANWWSCELNDQLNVCATSVTEGEVAGVKLV